jgi:hypothetical protein
MQSGIHPGGVHELEMLSGGYDATVLHQSTHPKQERVGPLSSEPIILEKLHEKLHYARLIGFQDLV